MTDSAPPTENKSQRTTRRLLWFIAVILGSFALLIGGCLAAFGSGINEGKKNSAQPEQWNGTYVFHVPPDTTEPAAQTTPMQTTPPTVTTPATTPDTTSSGSAASQLLAQLPAGSAVSDEATIDGTRTLVSATPAGSPDGFTTLSVWSLSGTNWAASTRLTTFAGYDPTLNTSEVSLVDVTTDGVPDIIFTFTQSLTNGHPTSQVFRWDGSTWVSADFVDSAVVEGLTVGSDGTLTSSENTCDPSCADGNYRTVTWTWDGTTFFPA